jgi:hypothetical protein
MLTCIQRENTTLTDGWWYSLSLWEWGAVQCYSSFTESLANHFIYRKEHTGQGSANPAHQSESCTWRLDLQDIEPSPTESPYPPSSLASRNRPRFPEPRDGPCNTVPHVHYSRSNGEYLLPLCHSLGWRFRTMSNLRRMCLLIS